MLKLSRKADYGLISLKHMATKNSSVSAREIAEAYGIPLPLLAKVLQKLARTGFLQSENGANGGYRLRRRAQDITALEVIKTIDGPVFLTSCSTGNQGAGCGVSDKCNVREPLRKVHEGIQNLLASLSIADMCDDIKEEAKEAKERDTTHTCGQPAAANGTRTNLVPPPQPYGVRAGDHVKTI